MVFASGQSKKDRRSEVRWIYLQTRRVQRDKASTYAIHAAILKIRVYFSRNDMRHSLSRKRDTHRPNVLTSVCFAIKSIGCFSRNLKIRMFIGGSSRKLTGNFFFVLFLFNSILTTPVTKNQILSRFGSSFHWTLNFKLICRKRYFAVLLCHEIVTEFHCFEIDHLIWYNLIQTFLWPTYQPCPRSVSYQFHTHWRIFYIRTLYTGCSTSGPLTVDDIDKESPNDEYYIDRVERV